MDIGPAELLIILAIIIILFGAGRISKLGRELGTALREFRKGLTHPEASEGADEAEPSTQKDH